MFLSLGVQCNSVVVVIRQLFASRCTEILQVGYDFGKLCQIEPIWSRKMGLRKVVAARGIQYDSPSPTRELNVDPTD